MAESINPHYQKRDALSSDVASLIHKVRLGDRYALSKCITLVESNANDAYSDALEILRSCNRDQPHSFRIAITGPPGAGKSTMIEALGGIIAKDHKLAILAVDPSSKTSKGSILGDKTRMESLVNHPNVFIRPSAAGSNLGGVTSTTMNVIALCEMAGYDRIIIETVGVGQSEVEVANLVDLMILVTLPGAGDELQGIKRGIMELADIVFVNKADGSSVALAKQSKKNLENALHLMQPKIVGWAPKVLTGSAIDKTGLTDLLYLIETFREHILTSDNFTKARLDQAQHWINVYLQDLIMNAYLKGKELDKLMIQTSGNESSVPFVEAYQIFKKLKEA